MATPTLTRIVVNKHTTLVMNGKEPVKVENENDGSGFDPVDDAAQWLGHPLECSEPEQTPASSRILYTYRVWFNENCGCSTCTPTT